jgi:hypothetical protein
MVCKADILELLSFDQIPQICNGDLACLLGCRSKNRSLKYYVNYVDVCLWQVTPCGHVSRYKHYGVKCCLYLQPWRWHLATTQKTNIDIFIAVKASYFMKFRIFWDVALCSHVEVDEDSPDDGGSNHFWNIGQLQRDYTALHPRRLWTSYSPPWEPEIFYISYR